MGFPWQFSENFHLWTIQSNAFALQLRKRCLCSFQQGYLNYTICSFSMLAACCAHFEPDLHQPLGLWSILKQRHHARLGVSLWNPTMAGESDLKTTSSYQEGITVVISTVPFGCTLLDSMCSLIFWTTIVRTWFHHYFLTVCGLCCSGLQLSGLWRRLQFSQWMVCEPDCGIHLEPTLTWFISSVTLSIHLTELDEFSLLERKVLCLS